MNLISLALTTLLVSGVICKPLESTHQLLTRLGFDPVQKPGINLHRKRVADESDKGRHQAYNSDSDSNLYVVRLPPHQPYYTHSQPELSENDVLEKPMSLPVNGKPNQVYHFNLPHMQKMTHKKHKKKHKHHEHKHHEHKHHKKESKIVRLKIKANQQAEFFKKLRNEGKPAIYEWREMSEQQNDMPANNFQNSRQTKDSSLTFIKKGDYLQDKKSQKGHQANSVVDYIQEKKSQKGQSALVYSPAIPKNNSFHKYFPGNGKPKSFYVIDKNSYPSQSHKLL